MDTDELYENIYKIDTNCIYDMTYINFIELTDKTYKINDAITTEMSKEKNNILNNYSNEILYDLHNKIIPIDKIKQNLLTYDFMYGNLETICETMNDVINLLLSELNEYQWTVGGFNIEDKEWIECTEKSRFKPHENQKVIYNTIESHNVNNDLNWFIKTLITRVTKTIKTKNKLKIYYKTIEDETNEITWLIIIVEKID